MSKYIIIGGVAGGATTAARLRRLDEKAEILLIERGENISYANCGFPYYVGGVIAERDKLFVQTPASFNQRFNIDVRVKSEAIDIVRSNKTIKIKKADSGEVYEESYDKLVFSPGATAIKPPIPGIDEQGVFTLRSVEDTDRIKQYMAQGHPTKAVIVGAGFIGLEMAENLRHKGIEVTIVEMAEQVMNMLDFEMAAQVHQHLRSKNITLHLKDSLRSFAREGNTIVIQLSSGKEIRCDMVILSLGIKPDSALASKAGLKVGAFGGIEVNEFLQTSDPDIYAVGDAIEFLNPIINIKMPTYLAGPANKQGRIAADNIVGGNKKKYAGSISTAIAKVFDLSVATAGISEKIAKKYGVQYYASITHGASHAGYYPDSTPLTIKIIFAKNDGQLLGAQVIGQEGVDKRIDLLSTIIKNKGTIYDLEEIEHAYAPPYSSAKDPVNIAGFVAENILTSATKVIHWEELISLKSDDIFLLDVRTPEEYSIGNIDGSVNIPLDTIRNNLDKISKTKKIVIYCAVGLRGYLASRILDQNGFKEAYNLSGGYKTYSAATKKHSNEDTSKVYIGKDDTIYQTDPNEKMQIANGTITIVDATGIQCPGPIIRLKSEMDRIKENEQLKIIVSDKGFANDVASWCNVTGNKLISLEQQSTKIIAIIEKSTQGVTHSMTDIDVKKDRKTIIVFSDDLDKALAAFVIANGAASMGKKVTMFFTFWGLNVIKKLQKPKTNKDLMGKLFGMMMPTSSLGLKLSKMNMLGLGTFMMRLRMNFKKVDSIEQMIDTAIKSGVDLVACQMSLDVMGVNKEELLDGVQIGGVAMYLEAAEKSNLNLFV
ncbi:MAG: pyridine nucleotide-disulfide oxidoreductase [Candidatus Margulisiibacteriota bacterium]|nr:MAG: pyridine nucleotide-disulfide oxidoreductase [Candidatus Margulisbacteria bacterium GWD2_39_127]OGI02750.1 MAG: pyridine nucleotide-disulfide oxidoreductase [Candidatus Margulisbacteria bacterium GWF2_38_17]OGI09364.1 MAG: pyridine nucleotide-disulfide oxidoreductase [Candidatus Margulisbacteria bacterium GWE2_39_32]PZM84941.1 MAG: pyridine nucleotide-disulfide oxidoreductase [Candidatus Margulisiibacteriota bacterium]HAR63653.1 pyridine nucleotide-disulfide oxidoreductase [Candidatus M